MGRLAQLQQSGGLRPFQQQRPRRRARTERRCAGHRHGRYAQQPSARKARSIPLHQLARTRWPSERAQLLFASRRATARVSRESVAPRDVLTDAKCEQKGHKDERKVIVTRHGRALTRPHHVETNRDSRGTPGTGRSPKTANRISRAALGERSAVGAPVSVTPQNQTRERYVRAQPAARPRRGG